jgi:Phytanoyl-CoA dioxygenase (PhyH)
MPIALDRRTRIDADVRHVSMDEFLADDFPGLRARHGALVAQGIVALGAPPLAIEIAERSWTFSGDGTTVLVAAGVSDGALVVTFDDDGFSDWVQNQRSFNAMLTARELRYRGQLRDVSVWDSLWLALLEGWPVVDDAIVFLDRSGSPLDFGRVFTPDDDPADIAHFLRETGFLHLRGWLDPQDIQEVSAEIDHFGRHAYGCASPVTGIAVTASSEANGLLRVIAGSHRVLMPVEIAKSRPYLPVVAVPTEPGDVTVHLSCTIHDSTPPLTEERRVLYTGFSLPPREDVGTERRGSALGELRERVYKIVS